MLRHILSIMFRVRAYTADRLLKDLEKAVVDPGWREWGWVGGWVGGVHYPQVYTLYVTESPNFPGSNCRSQKAIENVII